MSGRELSTKKKLEIIHLYFHGLGYDEIARSTGTSKGSVHNVVKDLREGRFPAVARAEEVDLLRDLAVSLRKLGVDAYRAMVGLACYGRLKELRVEPAQLSDLIRLLLDLKPDDVSVQVFIAAALRLHRLTEETGRDFQRLVGEAEDLEAKLPALRRDVESLTTERGKLRTLAREEKAKLERLKKEREEVAGRLATMKEQLNHIERAGAIATQATEALEKHVGALESRKGTVESQIEGLNTTLKGLQGIGLDTRELRRLCAALDGLGARTGADRGGILERLLHGIEQLEGVINLERERQQREADVSALDRQIAALQADRQKIKGRITALENEKAELQSLVDLTKERAIRDIEATLEATGVKAYQACLKVAEIAGSLEAPMRQAAERVGALNEEMAALEQDTSRYEPLAKLLRFLEHPLDLSLEESKPVVASLVGTINIWAEGRLSPIGALLISQLVSDICRELERPGP